MWNGESFSYLMDKDSSGREGRGWVGLSVQRGTPEAKGGTLQGEAAQALLPSGPPSDPLWNQGHRRGQ